MLGTKLTGAKRREWGLLGWLLIVIVNHSRKNSLRKTHCTSKKKIEPATIISCSQALGPVKTPLRFNTSLSCQCQWSDPSENRRIGAEKPGPMDPMENIRAASYPRDFLVRIPLLKSRVVVIYPSMFILLSFYDHHYILKFPALVSSFHIFYCNDYLFVCYQYLGWWSAEKNDVSTIEKLSQDVFTIPL